MENYQHTGAQQSTKLGKYKYKLYQQTKNRKLMQNNNKSNKKRSRAQSSLTALADEYRRSGSAVSSL